MAKELLMRVISSADHDISQDKLVQIVKDTGIDRYNSARKQQFDHFYGKHRVDFFAEPVSEENLETELQRMIREFPGKTIGDRGRAVAPDVAIIYDADRCEMIYNVYDELETSDCYRFIGSPKDALIEVRKV